MAQEELRLNIRKKYKQEVGMTIKKQVNKRGAILQQTLEKF